jgi:SSS family solute:Na+ symporter
MDLKVTSAYEILEIKLGISIRMLATFFFLSLRFLWMGTIIFITVHTAILSIFGFDPSYTLMISIAIMGITIFYTTLGGLKAVVFTDVIQSAVLLGGALMTLMVVSFHFGSVTSWIPQDWMGHWGELKYGLDARERLTIGNAFLTTLVWFIASAGSDQMSIQRFLATEDVRSARKTFGVSLITTFIAQFLLCLVGLAVLAYFTANPYLLPEGESVATHADNLFPRFILVGLPGGISGLVAAGILAAAMSSLSSGLNSTSSVISEDILKRFKRNYRKPKNEMGRIRNLSFFVGIFALILSLFISRVEGNLYDIVVKVVNLFVSPLFVLFFMALFIPFATAKGTFLGGVVSVAIAVAVAFFKFLGIEVLFIMPTSLFSGIILGIVFSYIDHYFLGNQETVAKRSREAKVEKE